jgi:hypothetical protein
LKATEEKSRIRIQISYLVVRIRGIRAGSVSRSEGSGTLSISYTHTKEFPEKADPDFNIISGF